MNSATAAVLITLGIIILALPACQTTAPSAECAFWTEPPITDNDADLVSAQLARWLDTMTSSADRVCR